MSLTEPSDTEPVGYLLNKAGVATVAGSAYDLSPFIRLSTANSDENLKLRLCENLLYGPQNLASCQAKKLPMARITTGDCPVRQAAVAPIPHRRRNRRSSSGGLTGTNNSRPVYFTQCAIT